MLPSSGCISRAASPKESTLLCGAMPRISYIDRDQKRHLRRAFVKGWELVPNTARLCIMNLYLHGIDADPCPVRSGVDSLAADPGERFSLVLTNPPFGKKGTFRTVNVR